MSDEKAERAQYLCVVLKNVILQVMMKNKEKRKIPRLIDVLINYMEMR